MLQFEHTAFLYALVLIPLLAIVFMLMLTWRRKKLAAFGEWSVIKRLMPSISIPRMVIKFVLMMFGFAFLILGLANLQVGSKLMEGERKGIDMMICLDVSNSMLAEDIKPNRLERSKQAISKLIDKLGGDRIGIIVFAGKAYIQLPITTDYAAAKLFLNTIDTKVVPTQGTAIGEAIEMAMGSFTDDTHSKAIVVITDGENHEDDAIEAAKDATKNGINVFTIGMGLSDGAPIPEYNSYGRRTGYKKDRQGTTIITKLNENMLQQIADAGKGVYVRANNSRAGLSKVLEEINKLEKTEFESKMYSDYEDRFQYFIGAALLFFLIELFIFERKSKWFSKFDLFKQK
jgi:Ca-activated chloride channel family protein